MYKQEKGITLIALIVTIIVLIILAAVTIVALAGDNNILSDAQLARCTNAYSAGEDQMKVSFMAVYSSIQTKTAFNSVYDATALDNAEALKDLIKRDLKEGDFDIAIEKTGTAGSETATAIWIRYNDANIQKNLVSDAKGTTATKAQPLMDSHVYGKITLKKQTSSFKYDEAAPATSTVPDASWEKSSSYVEPTEP